jgi:hypothetical protein
MAKELKFDEIGYWSELKLDIIRDYAVAYSTILAAQQNSKALSREHRRFRWRRRSRLQDQRRIRTRQPPQRAIGAAAL